MTEPGHGVQVVDVLKDHSYRLNETKLEQLLMMERVKDLPVVVVSVAGAYRGGKSFLLNFFLRYLTAPESARSDGSWLGEDSEPLVGFEWRGGIERSTTGILLWSEPILATLPSGEKVAVILMDTQGTFDSESTVRDNSTIFALSTLLSSVQVYNLFSNIQEDDLQHLQLFTMYGKMVQDKQVGKAFQTLEFLVRDWPYPEDYEYGAEGGRLLLQKRLEMKPEQAQELRELRTHLRSCFEKLLCFLLPHPGFKVQRRTFKGAIKEIDPEFRTHLKDFVTSLLSSANLTPKTINGQRVTAGELFTYFKTYITLFNSDELLNPRSIMQATAEAGLLLSVNAARLAYERGMEADCGAKQPATPPGDLEELHQKHLAAARAVFSGKKTMATPEQIQKYLEQLNKELDSRLPQYQQGNQSKLQVVMTKASDAYSQAIKALSWGRPLCLHPLDLEAAQKGAVLAALKIYDDTVKRFSNKPDTKKDELTQSFAANLVTLTATNEQNNKEAVRDLLLDYWGVMSSLSATPPLPDAEFTRGHDSARNQALANFDAKRNRPNSFPGDAYKEELTKKIDDRFTNIHNINLRNIEIENKRKEEERLRIENERLRAQREKERMEQQMKLIAEELEKLKMEKDEEEQRKKKIEEEKRKNIEEEEELKQAIRDKFGCSIN